MASSTEIALSGDAAHAQNVVSSALAAAGFTFEQGAPGWQKISRGSMTRTMLLGSLAGKAFHVSFQLAFGVAADGSTSARLDRDLATGALKGGALGAAKTSTAYDETVALIAAAATQAGILVGVRPLA